MRRLILGVTTLAVVLSCVPTVEAGRWFRRGRRGCRGCGSATVTQVQYAPAMSVPAATPVEGSVPPAKSLPPAVLEPAN